MEEGDHKEVEKWSYCGREENVRGACGGDDVGGKLMWKSGQSGRCERWKR